VKPPRWPAIWMLGAGQCVYWGILYYAYAVLLVPMRAEFGVSQAMIAGAFSVGLGISAWLAPSVGRRLDRGDGPRLFRAGAIAAGRNRCPDKLGRHRGAAKIVKVGDQGVGLAALVKLAGDGLGGEPIGPSGSALKE